MDFKGSGKITISSSDYDKQISFAFPACSSATLGDGALPVGTSPVSAVISAFTEDGTSCTSIFVGAPSVSGQNVLQSFKFPTEGAGRYYLHFAVTIQGSKVVDATFNRIFCEDTSDAK